MPYLPQQQQPGPFPFLDEIEQRVHPVTGYVLGGVGAVGGYFYGLEHDGLPVVLFVGLGLIGGLLAVVLLKHLTAFLIGAALVAAATLGAWWLFGNEAALRGGHKAPAALSAPAKPSPRGLLDDLRKATGVQ